MNVFRKTKKSAKHHSEDHSEDNSEDNSKGSHNIKLICVGDRGCGKTALLYRFTSNIFPEYIPTVFENRIQEMNVDDLPINLALWDIDKMEEYDRLRPLSYHKTDVVLICYDMQSPGSLENITKMWAPEITYFCPGIPILLVGCKADLATPERVTEAENQGTPLVNATRVLAVKNEIGAKLYLACSAKTNLNVTEVFEAAVRFALQPQKASGQHQIKCTLL